MRWSGSFTTRRDGERGAATVLLVTVVAVALSLALALMALARVAEARGIAQAAADLGALAAAEAGQRPGGPDPCVMAAAVVRANGARIDRCLPGPGGEVVVQTSVGVTPLVGWDATASATARAGPVR